MARDLLVLKEDVARAQGFLKIPESQLLAYVMGSPEHRGELEVALMIKNHRANRSMLKVTWLLAIATIILSLTTIYFEHFA